MQAVIFDDVSQSKKRSDVHAWRTKLLSLMSILHGTVPAWHGTCMTHGDAQRYSMVQPC